MADETQPEVQPAAPAAAPVVTTEAVAPDPTQAAASDPGATPTTRPASPAATSGEPPAAITIDQFSKRSDADPLQGSFVKVVDGEHAGQIAAFIKPVELDPTGYPATILVRFRDPSHTHEYAVVDLGQVQQASQTGLVT